MSKIKGNGSTFQRWNGATWDKICQVYSISGIGIDFAEIENDTFLDDCDGGANARKFEIKKKDTGSATLENPALDLGFDPEVANTNESNQDLLVADVADQVQTYYMITFPNAEETGIIFYGRPKMFKVPDLTPDSFVHSNWEFLITEALGDLGFIYVDDITNFAVPADPDGPLAA